MKLNRITWTAFFFLSIISIAVWLKFSYPQLTITNFSIDRSQSITIAKNYLINKGAADINSFRVAAIYKIDGQTNRYLQKTIGFKGLKEFLKTHDFNMFYWSVRFFKESEKEGYIVTVNSASGEVSDFTHIISNNEARKELDEDAALEKAKAFLAQKFDFNPENYTIKTNRTTVRDNRSDYHFSWQKNNVSIPWSNVKNSGTGKLLIATTVSGEEVLSFSKNLFIVPDQFNRSLDNKRDFSRNMMAFIKVMVLFLVTSGIFFIIVRQNHLSLQASKKFYINIMLISFTLSLLASINQFENIMYYYKTTLALNAYLWRTVINTIIGALFITVAILIPSLAGELLHFESPSKKKEGSFLHYIQSTFASRNVTSLIFLGYLVCIIMLGIQSLLIRIGQTHFGVWIEHSWINNSSSAYLPFLAAFSFAYKASFSEEIMYRLYAISLGKKLINKVRPNGTTSNVLIVVLIVSFVWGFAHSGYPIFPMWFRGIEVTCIGLFLAFIYLRFGIIPVIVSHYLFDVFWNCAGYIFGVSKPFHFYSSFFILLLPLALGIIAFILNRKEEEQPLRWQLNKHQLYNLEILKSFLLSKPNLNNTNSEKHIKTEIISHGWDPAVVDVAIEDFQNTSENSESHNM